MEGGDRNPALCLSQTGFAVTSSRLCDIPLPGVT